jgi:hypothetical protein
MTIPRSKLLTRHVNKKKIITSNKNILHDILTEHQAKKIQESAFVKIIKHDGSVIEAPNDSVYSNLKASIHYVSYKKNKQASQTEETIDEEDDPDYMPGEPDLGEVEDSQTKGDQSIHELIRIEREYYELKMKENEEENKKDIEALNELARDMEKYGKKNNEESNDTPQTTSSNDTPQTTSSNDTPQTTSPNDTPQTTSSNDTPQTTSSNDTPQTTSSNDTPQTTSPMELDPNIPPEIMDKIDKLANQLESQSKELTERDKKRRDAKKEKKDLPKKHTPDKLPEMPKNKAQDKTQDKTQENTQEKPQETGNKVTRRLIDAVRKKFPMTELKVENSKDLIRFVEFVVGSTTMVIIAEKIMRVNVGDPSEVHLLITGLIESKRTVINKINPKYSSGQIMSDYDRFMERMKEKEERKKLECVDPGCKSCDEKTCDDESVSSNEVSINEINTNEVSINEIIG